MTDTNADKVICDQATTCPEPLCGGKKPHNFEDRECGHCPKNGEARCISSLNPVKEEWEVVGYLGEHEETGAVIKAGAKSIATTAGGLRYDSPKEDWAEYYTNARLIAAAPNTAYALQELITFLIHNGLIDRKDMTPIINRGTKALKKAGVSI